MARWRQAVELAMTDEDIEKLAAIARSRSEAARRVERAQILLAYRDKPSFFAVGQRTLRHLSDIRILGNDQQVQQEMARRDYRDYWAARRSAKYLPRRGGTVRPCAISSTTRELRRTWTETV
jgi:hypothetical protein